MVMILPYIGVSLAGLLLLWLSNKLAALNRNIAAAKSSGLPYRICRKSLSLQLFFQVSDQFSHRWGARIFVDCNTRHLSWHASQIHPVKELVMAKVVNPAYVYLQSLQI